MKIRESIQEIGFYIGLILIGWFLALHVIPVKIDNIEQKFNDRVSNLEDSVSKLNTQGLIQKSLKEIEKHSR